MPLRAIPDIVNDIVSDFDKTKKPVISYSWSDFYDVLGVSRFHESAGSKIAHALRNEHELILGVGNNAVIICSDKHHNRHKR
jgi:hypothetical protein